MSAIFFSATHRCRPGGGLRCLRCNAELDRFRNESLERPLAFALATAVLLLVSSLYPIVGLSVSGTSAIMAGPEKDSNTPDIPEAIAATPILSQALLGATRSKRFLLCVAANRYAEV